MRRVRRSVGLERLRAAAVGSGSGALRGLLAGALVTSVLATPRLAEACAVCTAGREEENQLAYLLTTIFMSLLPLLAVGTLIFVLWRRIRKLEAERGEAPREGTPIAAPAVEPRR